MEHEHQQHGEHCEHCVRDPERHSEDRKFKMDNNNAILVGSGIISLGLILSTAIYVSAMKPGSLTGQSGKPAVAIAQANKAVSQLQEAVIPSGGVVLPVTWNDLGKQLVAAGVIDEAKFTQLYAQRGGLPRPFDDASKGRGLPQDMQQMLDATGNGQIKMTPQNSGIILNLLWALGLGQKSAVLTAGPMMSNPSVQPSQFASTGGWPLADGSVMNHYAKHNFLNLTDAQEQLVESVAKNIYRPCCGNSTYFPDCNHGMAMLGLLELMASQGATADQMYRTALAVNSYWFPDTYLTIAQYLQTKGIAWNAVKPQDILGANYSSGQGYQRIVQQVQATQQPAAQNQGSAPAQRSGPGCGA